MFFTHSEQGGSLGFAAATVLVAGAAVVIIGDAVTRLARRLRRPVE